ncbi:MAG: TlpA family protein disulfide reductase [Verrucomicrobiae bacterium]|nr:TlpA family protein disulfide reductase [Verrucomicrobiae bacterium]NNJ87407.1 TlpA family protein disulfide reductase [Akkermansiaceae bacterium]
MIATKTIPTVIMALVVMTLSQLPARSATDAEASAITGEYDRLLRLWLSEMRMAPDARSLDMIAKKRPNPAEYGAKLKTLLRSDLIHDWTLKYGAWLLENDTALKAESQRALLNAVENHHMKSPLLGRFCIAMIHLDDAGEMPRPGTMPLRSRGMKLLERIKKENPHPKVQGQAALALSMMLGALGDDRRIMEQRIKNIREAIIKSADEKVGGVTVADIARDELFKIKSLSKGRLAPEIAGNDSGGRPLKLSDFRGKVVMLVFWSSWDPDAARALELLRKIAASKADQPFLVLGVNRDSISNLRALEADRIATWRNFSDPKQTIARKYRIGSWPYCMVIGQKGVIHYRGAVGAFADAVATDLLSPK